MSTPALLRLREKFPKAHIALLTPEKLRDLWLNHRAMNEVITFGEDEGVIAVGRKLRAGNFEVRWCCRIRQGRRWKSGWRRYRDGSGMRGPGGIYF